MPKPFRLQVLLDHKQQLEEQQMLVLSEREAERRRAIEVLDMLRVAEDEQMRHLDVLARDTRLDPFQQRDAVAYLGRIERSIVAQGAVIAEAEIAVAEARDALVELLKEKRSLERLRERHVTEVTLEEGRRESRVVDEITSARYVRALQGQV